MCETIYLSIYLAVHTKNKLIVIGVYDHYIRYYITTISPSSSRPPTCCCQAACHAGKEGRQLGNADD